MADKSPASGRLWTAKEDGILRREAEKQLCTLNCVSDWSAIAKHIPQRSNKDCRKRWSKIGCTEIRKGRWTVAEDDQLRRAVARVGLHWTAVAEDIRSRNADQCAKRWSQYLDPGLDHSKWSEQDHALLLEAVTHHGHNWKAICETHFPKRSQVNIKNRYNTLVQRNSKDLAAQASPLDLLTPVSQRSLDFDEESSDNNLTTVDAASTRVTAMTPSIEDDFIDWSITDPFSNSVSQTTNWLSMTELADYSTNIFPELHFCTPVGTGAYQSAAPSPQSIRQSGALAHDQTQTCSPTRLSSVGSASEGFDLGSAHGSFTGSIQAAGTEASPVTPTSNCTLLINKISGPTLQTLITRITSLGPHFGMNVSKIEQNTNEDDSSTKPSGIAYRAEIYGVRLETAGELVRILIASGDRGLDFRIVT